MQEQRLRFAGQVLLALGIVATFVIFLVILVGFLDTITGSALGCGRVWPLCDGRFVPGPTLQSLIEYTHRALASIGGTLTMVAAVWAIFRYRRIPEIVWLASIAFIFIVVQSAVGAIAIFNAESAPLLATHFTFALLAFGGIYLLTVLVRQIERPEARARQADAGPRALTAWAWVAFIYTVLLIYWGTLVAHLNAGVACSGWPLCNGEVWPGFHGLVGVIFAHRLGALGAGAIITGFWLAARHRRSVRPDIYRAASGSLVLVCAQIASGAYLVLSHISVPADLIHVSIATLLFVQLAYGALLTLHASPGLAGALRDRGIPAPLRHGLL